jgi:NAD(P)-dependent dehydrogenase (short-subunit alcohol dehydrogenase family)
MTPASMTGKVALVTGAASGLGQASAILLAGLGARVWMVDINADGLADTAARIAADSGDAQVHATDLTEPDNCAAAVAAVIATDGRLDALCNVAGRVSFVHTPQMSARDYGLTMAINLHAPFHLCQAAIPHLLKADGAIVNVTSTAAFVGQAYLAAYCASKAGLTHMTKALAMEYMHQPIRINAVAPGGMMTGIVTGMTMPPDIDRTLIDRFSGLRGLVDVEEVAQVIAYLASPAARGFHGACINMDRGITAG